MKNKRSIMLVKNDPVIAADLLRYLDKLQYEIYSEHDNMLEAILSIQGDQLNLPDILLVDLPFIHQEGHLQMIKIFRFLYPVAIVIMTGSHTCDWIGFKSDYILPLPFSEVQLKSTLNKVSN